MVALAGVLAAIVGLVTSSGAVWPRGEVVGALALTLAASVAWWLAARRAGPADETLLRFGWWPAHRQFVADTVLIIGGICLLAVPSAVESTDRDLLALRASDPVIRQVKVISVENPGTSRGRTGTTYHVDMTVEVPYPSGPPVRVTERFYADDKPRSWEPVYALYQPYRPEAGLVLGRSREGLAGVLQPAGPDAFVGWLLIGLAVIVLRGVGAGPPGGWRSQARLRRELRRGVPAIVLEGHLRPSTMSSDSTLPAEFHGAEASGTIHLNPAFDLRRMQPEFSGTVRLCWLPGTRPGRWRKLHAAILVTEHGRYAPVGIRSLPPVHATRRAPVPDRLVGPFPHAGGNYRGLLLLTGVLALGAFCAGVLVPVQDAATVGGGFDNDMSSSLGVRMLAQVCLLLMPLVVTFYYLGSRPSRHPPDRAPTRPDTAATG